MNITFITSLYFADLKSKCLQIFLISQVLLQKQPPEVFCKKTCIQKSLKIHRKKLKPPTLSKKRLWHECFPKNFAKFLKTLFLQNPPDGCFCSYSALLLMLLLSQNIKAQFIKIVTFVFCQLLCYLPWVRSVALKTAVAIIRYVQKNRKKQLLLKFLENGFKNSCKSHLCREKQTKDKGLEK